MLRLLPVYGMSYLRSRARLREAADLLRCADAAGVAAAAGLTQSTLCSTLSSMCAIYVRLKELRVALGLTQAELAARAGVRRATVSRIENAHVTGIDFAVLERLAGVLGVDPGMLISRVPPPAVTPGRKRSRGRRHRPRD